MECYHGICSVHGTYSSVDLSKSAQSVGILGHYTNKFVWKQKNYVYIYIYIIIKHTYINQYINDKYMPAIISFPCIKMFKNVDQITTISFAF